MRIEYHEANAIATLPDVSRRRPMCLNDWHKLAWRLFCGGRTHYQGPRPFIFRVHPMDDERVFIRVRSAKSFPGATQRRIDIEAGQSVAVDLCYVPAWRPDGSRKELTPRRENWPEIERHTLGRAGIEVELASHSALLGYFQLFTNRQVLLPVVHTSHAGTVADESAFVQAFLHGIGRKRGYGMGMITLDTDSSKLSQAA